MQYWQQYNPEASFLILHGLFKKEMKIKFKFETK
jgi:hypothetical protein